jgi:hypothetical protein
MPKKCKQYVPAIADRARGTDKTNDGDLTQVGYGVCDGLAGASHVFR